MAKVLILNHQHVQCGIFQFGKRVYELSSKSYKVNYFYRIVSNREDYLNVLQQVNPDFIIYNYHFNRMPWLLETDITENKKVKHYFIYHDGSIMNIYDKYLMFGDYSPHGKNIPEDKKIILPRPLFNYSGDYPENKVFTIGSFGFAFSNKGFPELVRLVNETLSEAVINIHLTSPYFGDTVNHVLSDIMDQCRKNNKNPNIKLNLFTNFVDDTEVIKFLAGNDINILNYEKYPIPSLSSASDYLLSVKRPIAITNHEIFRHIVQDDLLLEKNSIRSIWERGTKPLQKYYDMWSQEKFVSEMENLFL